MRLAFNYNDQSRLVYGTLVRWKDTRQLGVDATIKALGEIAYAVPTANIHAQDARQGGARSQLNFRELFRK